MVTAQVSALNARRTLLQLQVNRQTAAVALIQALGGGWQAEWGSPTSSRPASAATSAETTSVGNTVRALRPQFA